jgi:hypothetical protein
MLTLVSIFLLTFIASGAAVWLYRKISNWNGFSEMLVDRSLSANHTKMGFQKGFVSLFTQPQEKARKVRLRAGSGDIKAPWGW